MRKVRYRIKDKVRELSRAKDLRDINLAEKMGMSPQLFSYKMQKGFSVAETKLLCAILKVDFDEVTNVVS